MDLDTLLTNCQKQTGVKFVNTDYLRTALTHSSAADTPQESNERMEFLGDSILAYTICLHLFSRFPDMLEGDMTKVKSAVVSRMSCGAICKRLGLDKFLILGRGLGNKAIVPDSMFSNLLEAFIAAIFLDRGYEAAKNFILREFQDEIDVMLADYDKYNTKSVLQILVQKRFHTRPEYTVLTMSGSGHRTVFHVAAQIAGQDYPPAWGVTKKQAEQRAAENALAVLKNEPVPYL